MPLITEQDFFDDFNIAQKREDSVAAKIASYIDMYEQEYIEGALGEDFAALFNANLADARFAELQDILTRRPSPIAGYVFCMYLQSESVVATGSGDAKGKAENATRSPESLRLIIAWNIMVDKTRKFQCWLEKNQATYPEFDRFKTNVDLISKVNHFGI